MCSEWCLVCWVLLQLVFFLTNCLILFFLIYEIHITLSRKHVSMSLICFTVLIRCRHSTLKYEKPSLHLLYTVYIRIEIVKKYFNTN